MQTKLSIVNDLSSLLDGAVDFLCIDDQAFSVDIIGSLHLRKELVFLLTGSIIFGLNPFATRVVLY